MSNLMYDLESIRGKMRKRKGGKARDPNEWRPDKAESGKPLKWKFFVLPPVDSMDLWYYEHGQHWIEKNVIECPRIHDGTECPLCQFGFDLMKETNEKEERRKIARNYLASSRYAANIYFPAVESTPSDLRGKVMWFSMPQSVYMIMEEVIMRDPPAADALEPEAHGIFFDPKSAFPFVLEARKKGDFNSYESSHFINKKMLITKGGEEKIDEIIGQRHDVPSLFVERDVDPLQTIVDSLTGEEAKPAKDESKKDSKPAEPAEPDEASELDDLSELEEETPKAGKEKAKKAEKKEKKAEVEVEDDDLNSLLGELNDES